MYVDGNIEITNFNGFNEKNIEQSDPGSNESLPDYDSLDSEFDFSFLDNIKEITGYLLIHNSKMKSLRFKSLEIIRGKNRIRERFSVFIDSNSRLEKLDLTRLRGNCSLSLDFFLIFYFNMYVKLKPPFN